MNYKTILNLYNQIPKVGENEKIINSSEINDKYKDNANNNNNNNNDDNLPPSRIERQSDIIEGLRTFYLAIENEKDFVSSGLPVTISFRKIVEEEVEIDNKKLREKQQIEVTKEVSLAEAVKRKSAFIQFLITRCLFLLERTVALIEEKKQQMTGSKTSECEDVLIIKNMSEEDELKLKEAGLILLILRTLSRERMGLEDLNTAETYHFLYTLMFLPTYVQGKRAAIVSCNAIRCIVNLTVSSSTGIQLFTKTNGLKEVRTALMNSPLDIVGMELLLRLLYHVEGQLGNGGVEAFCMGEDKNKFVATLTGILVWCQHQYNTRKINAPESAFLKKEKDINALVIRVLQYLYALGAFQEIKKNAAKYNKNNNDNNFEIDTDTMTILAFVLKDLLTIVPLSPSNMKVKLHVINLLMYIPDNYITYLVESNSIIHLVDILHFYIDRITVDPGLKSNDFQEKKSIAILLRQVSDDLLPLLILLTTIATKSLKARKMMKNIIFKTPPPEPENVLLLSKTYFPEINSIKESDLNGKSIKDDTSEDDQAKQRGEVDQNNFEDNTLNTNEKIFAKEINHGDDHNSNSIRPSDTPMYSFRRKLISCLQLVTSPNINRYVGELLYILCDENKDEFVSRTGIGNAIGLLRVKGIFGI